MKLEEMKRIADARTRGEWYPREDYDYYQGGTYLGVGPLKYVPDLDNPPYNKTVSCAPNEVQYFEEDICRIESHKNLEFIAMAANNWDKLMAVAEAAKGYTENGLTFQYDRLIEALEELDYDSTGGAD